MVLLQYLCIVGHGPMKYWRNTVNPIERTKMRFIVLQIRSTWTGEYSDQHDQVYQVFDYF